VVGAPSATDEESMSRAALSAQVFAVYVMATGAAFVVAPNALLSLFGVPPTTEPWAHVVGVLAFMIGIYAWVGGRHDHRPFLVASVATRVLVFAAFTSLVLLDVAPPVLALFGVVDLAGALWTCVALRADARSGAPAQPAGTGFARSAHATPATSSAAPASVAAGGVPPRSASA
jgi:hypothetical protein